MTRLIVRRGFKTGCARLMFAVCLVMALVVTSAGSLHAQPAALPHTILDNDMTGWDTVFLNGKTPGGTAAQADAVIGSTFRRYVALGDLPGVDGQSLSVLYSSFPGWGKSSLYTLADHDRFLRGLRYYQDSGNSSGYPGGEPSGLRLYLQTGHDFVADFMNYQSQTGQGFAKILSYRLNDYHWNWEWPLYTSETKSEMLNTPAGSKLFCDRNGHSEADVNNVEHWTQTSFTQYFQAFQTGQLDPALSGRCIEGLCLTQDAVRAACGEGGQCVLGDRAPREGCAILTLNIAVPVVEQFKIMQMAEVVKNYRPRFFEIDVDRNPQDFPPDFSTAQRVAAMTGFLQRMAATLRQIDPDLRIGLRIPSKQLHREALGIDLPTLDQDGFIDYVILAMPALADQQIQYEIDPASAHMKVYSEVFQDIGSPSPKTTRFYEFAGLAKQGY